MSHFDQRHEVSLELSDLQCPGSDRWFRTRPSLSGPAGSPVSPDAETAVRALPGH